MDGHWADWNGRIKWGREGNRRTAKIVGHVRDST